MTTQLPRRMILGAAALGAVGLTAGVARAEPSAPPTRPVELNPGTALEALKAGNARFTSGLLEHPDQSPEHRVDVSSAQHPFAVVLSCSDSRLSPEVIFDQGLGDLFVIRVAGNIVDPALLGSIEYAVEHLNTPLVAVIGHQNCGAVSATLEALRGGGQATGNITTLVDAISPAVRVAESQPGDQLTNAIRINTLHSRDEIRSAPELASYFDSGALGVVTGFYNLDTGVVDFDPS